MSFNNFEDEEKIDDETEENQIILSNNAELKRRLQFTIVKVDDELSRLYHVAKQISLEQCILSRVIVRRLNGPCSNHDLDLVRNSIVPVWREYDVEAFVLNERYILPRQELKDNLLRRLRMTSKRNHNLGPFMRRNRRRSSCYHEKNPCLSYTHGRPYLIYQDLKRLWQKEAESIEEDEILLRSNLEAEFQRFIPFSFKMFIALALKLKQYNIFGRKLGKRGRSNFPDFYRLMVVLAYLKLGTFQTMPCVFAVGVTTARTWVEDFIYNVCNQTGPNGDTLYQEYVNFDGENWIMDDLNAYELQGLPGAFGSVDGTHVKWFGAPVGDSEEERRNFSNGHKDGVTLNFQVIVATRTLRILHCSKGYPGTTADSRIFKTLEDDTRRMLTHQTRSNIEFNILQVERMNGRSQIVKRKCYGGYLLSDQGYFDSTCLIHPISEQQQFDNYMTNVRHGKRLKDFSERIESVRKDVECAFGVLKKKFRVLHGPFTQRHSWRINGIFKTCCFLFNFDLECQQKTSFNIIWKKTVVTNFQTRQEDVNARNLVYNDSAKDFHEAMQNIPESTLPPLRFRAVADLEMHRQLRNVLAENFAIRKRMNIIYWPSGYYNTSG